MMMPAQMMEPQSMSEMMNSSQERFHFTFKKANDDNYENNITIKKGKKVKELFDLYIDEAYGNTNKELRFVYNAGRIDRNDQRKVEEVCKNWDNWDKFTILVLELKPL